MNTNSVKLTQVKVNSDNPRTITNDKLNKLINSLLVFPKMLSIRPVVVDNKMVALGGNMRLQALKHIAKMTPEELGERLATIADYLKKSQGEKEAIARHWEEWLAKPVVEIINASDLTEDERKQFVIKDNVAFGTWDYDMLANKFDEKQLEDWGMDVWVARQYTETTSTEKPSAEDINFEDALPDELKGLDLTPRDTPKIEGGDERVFDYLSITYKDSEREALANLLGVPAERLYEKVVWKLDEIMELKY